MRPLGDRRAYVRLEVVGTLWGTLDMIETAQVLSISEVGALVAMRVAPVVHSVQPIELCVEAGKPVRVDARILHLEERHDVTGAPEYLVGLEFTHPPDAAGSESGG